MTHLNDGESFKIRIKKESCTLLTCTILGTNRHVFAFHRIAEAVWTGSEVRGTGGIILRYSWNINTQNESAQIQIQVAVKSQPVNAGLCRRFAQWKNKHDRAWLIKEYKRRWTKYKYNLFNRRITQEYAARSFALFQKLKLLQAKQTFDHSLKAVLSILLINSIHNVHSIQLSILLSSIGQLS